MTSRVVVLDDYQSVALSSADWAPVADRFEVDVVREHLVDEALLERLRGARVVVAMRERTPFPADLLRALPDLKLLVTTGMRNASIDLAAAVQLGITVCGTDGNFNSVPELTIGMILALTRHFAEEDAAVRSGGWQHTIGPGLAGSTLGIVGLGRLGIPVARLAKAFAMDVVAWSPNLTSERAAEHDVRAVDKHTLFAESDVITVHMPLSHRSRGLIGADDLALMKPSAVVVNTSRGPIIDEPALVAALRERRIGGAALDVFDVEPLPADHPLRTMPNTLLLPHIGYVTTEAYRGWFAQVVENILAWSDDSPVRMLTQQ